MRVSRLRGREGIEMFLLLIAAILAFPTSIKRRLQLHASGSGAPPDGELTVAVVGSARSARTAAAATLPA